ncbi:hypothetical protein [Pectinatus sottacetonis]|uniref:hypothetical protein n=1 Tax=Pectinatus sottacetonis TaxID=1002795 RepID=UPI001E514EEB|nr:hypothetical protein [Pectinatus sottacetonis]
METRLLWQRLQILLSSGSVIIFFSCGRFSSSSFFCPEYFLRLCSFIICISGSGAVFFVCCSASSNRLN